MLTQSHAKGPQPKDALHVQAQYKCFKAENFVLTTEQKNYCCLLKDGTVVLIMNIVEIKKRQFHCWQTPLKH